MLSWTVWIPAVALSVIAYIGCRRLAAASSLLSPVGARLVAFQVAVAFALLAGTSGATEITDWCTEQQEGWKRCAECIDLEPPGGAIVHGEMCNGWAWLFDENFPEESCSEAEAECAVWASH